MPAISERSVDFPLPFMPHKAVMEFSGSEKFKFEKPSMKRKKEKVKGNFFGF